MNIRTVGFSVAAAGPTLDSMRTGTPPTGEGGRHCRRGRSRAHRAVPTPGIAVAVLLLAGILPCPAEDFTVLEPAEYVPHESNDGDSFLVQAAGKRHRVRLYFVDCPETTAATDADASRLREQTRYFGLANAGETTQFGKEAAAFTRDALAAPFTVHTAFASAGGRSSEGRVYAFVTTAKGKDLAHLLVANGYARTHGIGRKTPDGVSRDETQKHLQDVETAAAMRLAGIWAECDPDRLVQLRREQRKEEEELDEVRSESETPPPPGTNPVDINQATKAELESVWGIGPVLSRRIMDNRPYETVDDLLRVRGIGEKTLNKMRPHLIVSPQQ